MKVAASVILFLGVQAQTENLVGIGVGNLGHESIDRIVSIALRDYGFRVIDTAQASRNEEIIARAIQNVQDRIQIVTKVWYTMLGFERTRYAINETIKIFFEQETIDLIVLLHWPYCRSDISWMHCEDEETQLSEEIKQLGSPPHLDRENAWKDSWKALEDAYELNQIQGIGISNFDLDQTRDLFSFAQMLPHYAQINVWHVLYNQPLIALLKSRNVQIQVYNVMHGILARQKFAPKAYDQIQQFGQGAKPATVVLAWLAVQNIATIPRTANLEHLAENSPRSVTNVMNLIQPSHIPQLALAIRALFEGKDIETPTSGPIPIQTTFVLAQDNVRTELFYLPQANDAKPKPMAEFHSKGDAVTFNAYPSNQFLANIYQEHKLLEGIILTIDQQATTPQRFLIHTSAASLVKNEEDEDNTGEEEDDSSWPNRIDIDSLDDEL